MYCDWVFGASLLPKLGGERVIHLKRWNPVKRQIRHCESLRQQGEAIHLYPFDFKY